MNRTSISFAVWTIPIISAAVVVGALAQFGFAQKRANKQIGLVISTISQIYERSETTDQRLSVLEKIAAETAVLARISAENGGDPPSSVTPQSLSAFERRFADQLQGLGLATLESAALLNSWIFSSIGPGATGGVNPLISLKGECGDREFAFSQVSGGLSIPTRRIGFFKVPIQLTHVAVEAFIDGKWRFFDPTAGIYFSHPGDNKPIGIAEARAAYPDISVWQTNAAPWTGKRQELSLPTYSSVPISVIEVSGAPVVDIERTYFASDMTGASEENILFNSTSVDVERRPSVEISVSGTDDSDVVDGERYSPLGKYLGRVGNSLTGMRFWFGTQESRRARVTIHFTSKEGRILADLDHRQRLFGLEQTAIDRTETDKSLTLTFSVFGPGSTLSLWGFGTNGAIVQSYKAEFLSN